MLNLFTILFTIYSSFLVLFFYFILKQKTKKYFNYKFRPTNIIKDKEYLLFLNSLFNFYYTTIIILIFFLFKSQFFYLLINFNVYSFYLLFSILLIYYFLLNHNFTLTLFNLYKEIKICVNSLNEISFDSINLKYNKTKFSFKYQSKSFSTSAKSKSINEIEADLD